MNNESGILKIYKEVIIVDLISQYNKKSGEDMTLNDIQVLCSNNIISQLFSSYKIIKNYNIHYILRDILNTHLPQSKEELYLEPKGSWIKFFSLFSTFHDPKDHDKYVSEDGRKEVVYCKVSGDLITNDSIIMYGRFKGQSGIRINGTFNFGAARFRFKEPVTSILNLSGHFLKDVLPLFFWKFKK